MGLTERLRRLDKQVMGEPGRPAPSVRTATRLGSGIIAFGVILVLFDKATEISSSSFVFLLMGMAGGLWLGRSLEAKAQRQGKGLRSEGEMPPRS